MPKLSVVIPMFNAERTISGTIESITKSAIKYKVEYEIIVVDDGSTDRGAMVVNKIMESNKKVRYYYQKNNRQGSARNRGMDYAKGKFISFVDADDYVDIEYCEVMNTANLDCYDYIYFNYKRVYNDSVSKNIKIGKTHEDYVNNNSIKKLFFPASPVLAIYNYDFLIQNNIRFVESVQFEDIHFSFVVQRKAKKVLYQDSFLYYYRIHEFSTVRSNVNKKNLDIIVVFNELLQEKRLSEDELVVLEFLAVKHLYLGGLNRIISKETSKKEIKKYEILFSRYLDENFTNWKLNAYLSLKQKVQIRLLNTQMFKSAHLLILINDYIYQLRNKLRISC